MSGGWYEAERLFDADDEWIEDVRASVSIGDLSEALGVQVHDDGLTCPVPSHHQSGASAPANVFIAREQP